MCILLAIMVFKYEWWKWGKWVLIQRFSNKEIRMGNPLFVSCIGQTYTFLTRKKSHLFSKFCSKRSVFLANILPPILVSIHPPNCFTVGKNEPVFSISLHVLRRMGFITRRFGYFSYEHDVGCTYELLVRACHTVLFAISGIRIRSPVSGSIDLNFFNVNYSNNYTNS